MAKKTDIKFMHKLAEPRIRKRDGESITHSIVIGMTTEEAALMSEYFSQVESPSPRVSLVRAFLLQQALDAVDNDKLLSIMSAIALKKKLSEALSAPDFNRAMSFIKNPPVVKQPPLTPKPVRREYIPEPRRR